MGGQALAQRGALHGEADDPPGGGGQAALHVRQLLHELDLASQKEVPPPWFYGGEGSDGSVTVDGVTWTMSFDADKQLCWQSDAPDLGDTQKSLCSVEVSVAGGGASVLPLATAVEWTVPLAVARVVGKAPGTGFLLLKRDGRDLLFSRFRCGTWGLVLVPQPFEGTWRWREPGGSRAEPPVCMDGSPALLHGASALCPEAPPTCRTPSDAMASRPSRQTGNV